MKIRTVGVVGGGLMGSGIAEVCARNGLRTRVCEIDQAALAGARARIESSLDRGRRGGKLSDADAERAAAQLDLSTDLGRLADCDVVIEAIIERLPEKVELFGRLDTIAPPHAVLASNTSSLPIIELARVTSRPHRVVGIHFFNPVPVMKLVELVRSVVTDEVTLAEARGFAELLGKATILSVDRAGFIVNMLLMPYLMGAIRMFEAGFASRDDIDAGMRVGCGHPMGPLELLDHIGLDTALFVGECLQAEYGSTEHTPPPLLRRMVAAGQLGRKSGRGFYEHPRG